MIIFDNFTKSVNVYSKATESWLVTAEYSVSFKCFLFDILKGEVSPNNNVVWVSRKQFYKPNSKSLSRFG